MSEGSPGRPDRGFRALTGLLAGTLFLGCSERDRLTFPSPGGGIGPTTTIDMPAQDTTVAAGPDFVVAGRTIDLDQVDTVYFLTAGGVSNFQPFIGPQDTVRFGLPLTTNGQSGQTVIVQVFGTDHLGNRGDTATRVVHVQ